MPVLLLIAFLALVFTGISALTYALQKITNIYRRREGKEETAAVLQGFVYTLLVLTILYVLALGYVSVAGSAWESHLM